MDLPFLDLAIIFLYFGGLAAMGIYFSRKNVSTEEYFVGGRSFPGWIIGLSLVGTAISSITFLAYPADAFKTTWIRFAPNLMLLVTVFIAVYLFLPFFRRGKITTAYEYLEGRFGPSIRTYGAATFIFSELIRISIVLYLLSIVLHEITGLTPTTAILAAGLFVSLYTVIGGIDTVIWTDVVQVVVFVMGGILCLIVIVVDLPGGLGQILTVATEDGKLAFAEMVDGTTRPVTWDLSIYHKTASMMLIYGLINWLRHYCSNQNIIQRYAASRSVAEARKAMFIAAFLRVPIWAFFFFLGTSLYVFFKVFPAEETVAMLRGALKAEQVLPYFIIHHLPTGLTGLVLAAALAAAMSSLDSSINAISTVGVVDIYRRHFVKDREDKHYLKIAYMFASIAGAAMVLGAIVLFHAETKTIEDAAIILVSLFTGGMLGVYLLGFLTTRGDARAVGAGIAFAVLFTLWVILSDRGLMPEAIRARFDLYYTAIFVNLGLFLVGFLAAFLLPDKQKKLENLTVWTQDREPLD